MEINIQRVEGGNSASSLLCELIEALMELKCKLWRKTVENLVKILAGDSFSIRNRADTRTETTRGNKCGHLLRCSKREESLAMASGPLGCFSASPLAQKSTWTGITRQKYCRAL